MADISKITLPNGSSYDIKDATARSGLAGKLNTSLKGAANGLAELDASGKVPSSQLPSYVDDVLEYTNQSSFPTTGENGKIYIAQDTNKTYRWSGSAYVEISPSLALGEISSTAYRGDRGKIAYDHSQSTHARTDATKVEKSTTNGNIKINGTETTVYTHPSGTNPHGTTKSDVGLGNVGNFKAVSTVASQGLTDTEKSNARTNIGAGTSSFSGSYNDLTNKPTIPTNNNQLTNGAGYITSSGTAKTISDTLPISKGGTGKTTGADAANTLINSLSEGTSTPTDTDYYVSQYAGGGTTTTTYHRRPVSALWNYIKSKLATVATSGSYSDLSNKPTIPSVGNGTITIKQAGTTKGTFTTNQSGNTTIELADTTYRVATSSALGLVKSGTDITVDSSGNVSVNDDSHNHVISNVDGLQSALDGKANTSHGNHVPTTQTANNAIFLRNDNTWQKVTPANIGAAASSHPHTKSQITDFPSSLPASDVYSWAKASTKPNYSYNEITSKPSITPQAYGAKGDGSTNDTTAFTNMLNAIASKGGVVFIPNGTYIINSITIPDNITLVGESLNAILKQSSTAAHMITLGNNCRLESLSIDGNGSGKTGDYASVYIYKKNNCVITECKLYNGVKWNVYSHTGERVVIEHCETYGCVTGAAITITGTNNGYCRINHCYSHNNKLDGFVIAQPFTIIENCYSYQNGTSSLGAAGIYCNDNADFSTINNNIIDSNYGIGIEVAGNSQNIIISKNRVTNNKTDGIEVRQNAQPIITENYLYNNTSAQFSAQISYSVTAGAYYAIINNNIIDCNSQTNYGIYAPNATDCLGTNIIVNANTAPMNVNASSQLGAVKDNQYEYYKRKYIRFTDSRWLNVVNAGSSTNIDIAGNQTFRFVSTDGGYQRVKMINNMSESKPASPVSGDYYCDASGLHIYRNNTWKTIAYTS